MRADQLHALPERFDDGLAAMMEPFAVGLHAVKRAGTVSGKTVLVTEGGKYTDPNSYGIDTLDYSESRIRTSLEESAARLGTDISQVALRFSSQHPDIPTTMFSSANPESVKWNVAWHTEPVDRDLVKQVQNILEPVMNVQWTYE